MQKISVIIPFYQRETGILKRAVQSVYAQIIPPDWSIELLIIDDGSPVKAEQEISAINFSPSFHLKIIHQDNGGVATARNRGLKDMDTATTLVAFLDSDDTWPDTHLSEAIKAHHLGYDFSFSDNFRDGHHKSYTEKCAVKTQALILRGRNDKGLINIPTAEMPSLIIEEFPTQASTVAFNKELADGLRFNTDLKAAGEDILFFVALVGKANKICYNSLSKVACGGGVNIFFGNFDWDSPSYLRIKQDRVRCHTMIGHMAGLPMNTQMLNKKLLTKLRCDFIFHSIRQMLKHKHIPDSVSFMAKMDRSFWAWSLSSMFRIMIGYPMGYYKP